jgi:hypothetical protein
MHYELQKAMQRELNERIPPAAKGDPQNELRHVVNSQRFSGKTFDQSVTIAILSASAIPTSLLASCRRNKGFTAQRRRSPSSSLSIKSAA